ncbi:hypothetical protein J7T55_007551 [Diaporthe amygdali]|uniref:uncharacterized protein n=1 Tax=Phomopsis amygdali TaxID=1214568 RepID=UPI0022FE3229|nr:uncharacterized protein J7T55_007551 [Diaporthe amygdali]KAJ0100733.1 hypothetical protein J7T55_007551 [Diaporthe amygdali]
MATSMIRYKLIFHAPLTAVAACKEAIFAAGAGEYPAYSECAFTVVGTGQFRPRDAASPHIGKVGALEEVQEASVETLCVGEETTKNVVQALKKAHPYEEPSYHVYKLEDF